ncbi:hypothetical protein, partial [Streptomyces himastatinicus]|uniref:hypothetical protein n=1 Tax=Streptomyces himastatinicus TaxID=998084 RepID=UPI0001B4C6F4
MVPALSVLMVLLLAAGWLMSARLVDGVPALAVASGRTAASFPGHLRDRRAPPAQLGLMYGRGSA